MVVLIGLIVMATQPQPALQNGETAKTTQPHAEKQVEMVKPKSTKKLTWKDNPYKCNLNTQYVRKDNLKCVDKPTAPTTPKTVAYAVGCERYRHLVEQYSWNVTVAMQVMQAESGCNPQASNWNDNHGVCMGSFGLFQISCHGGQIYDPAKNVAAAWAKYQANRWQPWGVCTSGKVVCN